MIFNIISCALYSNQPIAIVSLDVEKAFDKVNCQFSIFKIEKKIGFGESVCHTVRVLYTSVMATILNPG